MNESMMIEVDVLIRSAEGVVAAIDNVLKRFDNAENDVDYRSRVEMCYAKRVAEDHLASLRQFAEDFS